MNMFIYVYPWQKWALTFSFSSSCILIAAWCRQDGREQSVHQRWAEHVRWSRVSTREESFSTCQDTKHQGQQKAGPQIKFHNIPQFGNFILNPSLLKQYTKHAKTMLMLRKLAVEGQAPALQVRDQSLCLLRAQVSCDETAHFMSSHGEQSSRGYDVVVSSATHNCFGHHKGLQHV